MKAFTIHPRDLLFFRDARPMAGSSEGAGACWPLPSVLHSALLSAFHDHWPDGTEWESSHLHWAEKEKRKQARGQSWNEFFGGLRTLGPFPWLPLERKGPDGAVELSAGLYVPTPADVVTGGVMQPVQPLGGHNLPKPLRYTVAAPTPPAKEKPGAWMVLGEFRKYLAGEADGLVTTGADQLYDVEPRPGVGIDPETHANRQSVFYQAEYLRLRDDVRMIFLAEAEAKKYGERSGVDLLARFLGDDVRPLIIGGQRGLTAVRPEPKADDLALPPPPGTAPRVKWVLLSPALFDNGWRPDWVGEDGKVLLKAMPDRAEFPTRRAWREAAKERAVPINAELVAARVPKPVPVSGWKLAVDAKQQDGPKPTRLLVPAGAVYYFECVDEAAAAALVRQLHLKVKSQRLGEQGFGFGVCGTWEFLDVGKDAVTR